MEESKNIKVTLQGDDNLSNYNNCGVEILIPKKEKQQEIKKQKESKEREIFNLQK